RGTMRRALFLTLLLAACSGGKEAGETTPSALVTTTVAAPGQIADTITAYGAAEFAPQGERTLIAPVDAVVAGVLAQPGTQVRAGQAVVALKLTAASKLDQTKTDQDAAVADAAFARAQRLRAAGLGSDGDVEAARAAAASADQARRLLVARTGEALTLRSPIDGVVESVAATPGELTQTGSAVAKVGALGDLRVRLGVEALIAARIGAGDDVRLEPLAGGPPFEANVTAVDPIADAQTRLASVFVAAPAHDALVPGAPVRGVITLGGHGAGVVVPRAAVLYEQDQPYVFVAAGGAAHRRNVALGADDGTRVEIQSGVTSGERIVVEGAAALQDGMAVREGKPGG
ncbi:MAG: efflux RND transporter periplasmic adaptor subunit, partial [Caulobacterales bacterium]